MREIIFDIESTGLDAREDRIIEIGAVELDNRFATGRTLHLLINPDGRRVHPEALAVHGIGNEMLTDKPRFAEIVQDWFSFTDGARLIAHNASFDVSFFNAELARIGFDPIAPARVVDSLALARRKHPMGPNSLDALCSRYGIDNSRRTKHGALLDSELLAEVYIELVGGRQAALGFDAGDDYELDASGGRKRPPAKQRPEPLPSRLTDAERAAHAALVARLGPEAIWLKRRAPQ